MPLDDTAAEPDTEAAPTVAKAPRGRVTIDLDSSTATYSIDGQPDVFAGLDTFPPQSVTWLALSSLGRLLSADATSVIADLRNGRTPMRGPGKPKVPPVLHQAIALALVDLTRKTDAPMTIEAATAKVAAMTRQDRDKYESHPLVNKHLVKLRPPADLNELVG